MSENFENLINDYNENVMNEVVRISNELTNNCNKVQELFDNFMYETIEQLKALSKNYKLLEPSIDLAISKLPSEKIENDEPIVRLLGESKLYNLIEDELSSFEQDAEHISYLMNRLRGDSMYCLKTRKTSLDYWKGLIEQTE